MWRIVAGIQRYMGYFQSRCKPKKLSPIALPTVTHNSSVRSTDTVVDPVDSTRQHSHNAREVLAQRSGGTRAALAQNSHGSIWWSVWSVPTCTHTSKGAGR